LFFVNNFQSFFNTIVRCTELRIRANREIAVVLLTFPKIQNFGKARTSCFLVLFSCLPDFGFRLGPLLTLLPGLAYSRRGVCQQPVLWFQVPVSRFCFLYFLPRRHRLKILSGIVLGSTNLTGFESLSGL
jgi:hypothetical protein